MPFEVRGAAPHAGDSQNKVNVQQPISQVRRFMTAIFPKKTYEE
jgi:hypothetical protein